MQKLNIKDTWILMMFYGFQKCAMHSMVNIFHFYIFTAFLKMDFLISLASMWSWKKNIVNIPIHSIYPIVKCISEAHSDLLLKSNITSSSSLESFFCVSAMQNCVLWVCMWVEKYYYSWVPFHWGSEFFFLHPNPKSILEQIWRLIWVHNCAQLPNIWFVIN